MSQETPVLRMSFLLRKSPNRPAQRRNAAEPERMRPRMLRVSHKTSKVMTRGTTSCSQSQRRKGVAAAHHRPLNKAQSTRLRSRSPKTHRTRRRLKMLSTAWLLHPSEVAVAGNRKARPLRISSSRKRTETRMMESSQHKAALYALERPKRMRKRRRRRLTASSGGSRVRAQARPEGQAGRQGRKEAQADDRRGATDHRGSISTCRKGRQGRRGRQCQGIATPKPSLAGRSSSPESESQQDDSAQGAKAQKHHQVRLSASHLSCSPVPESL